MKYNFHIEPVAKPRMTRSDKWKDRPAVLKYRAYADELRILAKQQKFEMPACGASIRFYLQTPISWPVKKRAEAEGTGAQSTGRNDIDNLCKAFFDALFPKAKFRKKKLVDHIFGNKDDSYIWDVRITKLWSVVPRIEVDTYDV